MYINVAYIDDENPNIESEVAPEVIEEVKAQIPQETVPEAIIAFLEGKSFINVIRTAVSLGGDCDTLTAIAGSIAEAFYGVSQNMKNECFKRLPYELRTILKMFVFEYMTTFEG